MIRIRVDKSDYPSENRIVDKKMSRKVIIFFALISMIFSAVLASDTKNSSDCLATAPICTFDESYTEEKNCCEPGVCLILGPGTCFATSGK